MFPDYHELRTLPFNVNNQILDSLSRIRLGNTNDVWRKAEACFTVAMLHLERIGTVRPSGAENSSYAGLEIDANEIMTWLLRAAELGSLSAQSTYFPICQAMKAYAKAQVGHSDVRQQDTLFLAMLFH